MLQLSTREAGTNLLAMAALLATGAPAWADASQSRVHTVARQGLDTVRTASYSSFVISGSSTAWFSQQPIEFKSAPVFDYRPTTEREEIIGRIRAWALLHANWDAEGCRAPNPASLKQAGLFVNLLSSDTPLPEPMLHANGRAGLYWNQDGLYADLEFLGDGRVSYYIERRAVEGKDKHKGVATVSGNQMPPVFPALLRV